jgi:hypothetical protein
MQILHYLRRHWKTTIWTIIIAILLFTPSKNLPNFSFLNFKYADKLVHAFLFLCLEYLLLLEYNVSIHHLKVKKIFLLSVVALIYGGSSEIIQLFFINGRSGSLFDFFADCIGILAAFSIYFLYNRFRNASPSLDS